MASLIEGFRVYFRILCLTCSLYLKEVSLVYHGLLLSRLLESFISEDNEHDKLINDMFLNLIELLNILLKIQKMLTILPCMIKINEDICLI